jgi:hypothetical protein
MRLNGSTLSRRRHLVRAGIVIGSLGCSATSFAQSSEPTYGSSSMHPVATQSPDVSPSLDAVNYAVLPEGKTLPADTFRLRVPFRSASGTFGYDQDGHKVNLGANLRVIGGGLVLEYGVDDRLSVQLLAPVVYVNQVGIDADKFRDSATYKDNYEHFVKAIGAQLQDKGICTSEEACRALIETGDYELDADTPVTLPTGETLVVKANTPLKQYADSLVANAAKPTSGKTGLGDIQIGALYAVIPEGPLRLSLGAGLRFPTGSFKDVPAAQRATGRGTFDGGLRANVDILPCPGIVLSWQNQTELMLVKGKRDKSSLLDPTRLNKADPTTAAAVAAGSDGKSNEQTFERVGARNIGFVRFAWGLGNVISALTPIGVWETYNYDVDGEERLDGIKAGNRSQSQSLTTGLGISGLAYKIPASLDFEYEQPVAGRNLAVAPKVFGSTLKVYYQF